MRRFLLTMPLLLLSACAGDGVYSAEKVTTTAPATTPYGLFLAGEGALNDGRSSEAAAYFEKARIDADNDPLVAERAFTSALLAGDVQTAAALAPTSDQSTEAGRRMGRLVTGVEALASGKGKAAYAILSGDGVAFPHKGAAALLAPWAAAQAGNLDGSLVRPEVKGDRLVDYFGQIGQAYLYERAKRYDEAETDFKAVTAQDIAGEMAVLAYGGFLERRGRRIDALALYTAYLGKDSANGPVKAAKDRAAAGGPAPVAPTIRQGAGQVMLAPAASMLSGKENQMALIYLRLALRLDPNLDQAWVMVGDLMAASGDTPSAREAYSKPKPGSDEYAAGQAKLAWTYQSAGDKETALKLARAAAASGDTEARVTLADLLRTNEQYAESAEVLTGLIAGDKTPDWRLLYARGVAYDKLGRWTDAQNDLQTALKVQPDEPELLNYLGYSWIDRGERLPEALAMVEKAVGANPRSGAMVDSLGWAYYRMGDFKKAVEKLEQAVELEAGDPEINNHLGDAYWRVGRRTEATFQWRRVLTLKPDDKIRAAAEAKLASSMGPDGPTPKLAQP